MTRRVLARAAALAAALLPAVVGAVGAQSAGPADTLTLAALQAEAERRDPRGAQLGLQAEASALRDRTLAVERLPRLSAAAEGTYQTAVASIPPELFARLGTRPPGAPPKDRYQATMSADQLLYDGGVVARRRAVERARLAESQADVRARVFAAREEVTGAFFAALLAQERAAQLDAAAGDLDARLGLARARLRAGAALPGDTAAVRAEVLRLGQQRAEADADRRAALAVLGALVGRAVSPAAALALPDLGDAVGAARARGATGGAAARARPEHERFARSRERLAREAAVAGAATRPRVSAFATGGYGRPGLNVLGDDFQAYALGGVRVQWPFLDWGTSRREQEALRLQQRVLDTEEAAFAERVARAVEDELAAIDRLEGALAVDDTIVALRERVEFEARRQLEEGALTAAEYVERRTDVTEARLARAARRVELARARAAYLTTLGVVPR